LIRLDYPRHGFRTYMTPIGWDLTLVEDRFDLNLLFFPTGFGAECFDPVCFLPPIPFKRGLVGIQVQSTILDLLSMAYSIRLLSYSQFDSL
jgi:hypothetical protein